jgi:undecaprenyl-diphosphatase
LDAIQAILLALIEGITEFLPVSSTGHMVLGSSLMGIASDPFVKLFTVAIQFGAILSVLVLYAPRFLKSIKFYTILLIAFIPAAIAGKLFNDLIDQLLESVTTIGITLLVGGVVLVYIDRWLEKGVKQDSSDENSSVPTPKKAFVIGLFQCLAMIPGVSRSAATIIGGLVQGLNRKQAAEFSFFLAVPTMLAATAYKLFSYWNSGQVLSSHEWLMLAIGNAVAFLVAMAAMKAFIGLLTRNGFKWFGYYRIVVGLIILILQSVYNLSII